MTEYTAETKTHGRYLTLLPMISGPARILAGFHGYAENAEIQLERLRSIAEAGRWLCVSIQALHPFYRGRTNEVVASWMTVQHRELAIADNIAWVEACLDSVAGDSQAPVVFVGFSQGVAMAYRAAVNTKRRSAVIAVGGDIPPEITWDELQRISSVLIARGKSDDRYTPDRLAADRKRLNDASSKYRTIEYKAGHEWSFDVTVAASDFLAGFRAAQGR